MNEFHEFLAFLDDKIDYYNSLAESFEIEKERWGIAYCIDEILMLENLKEEAQRNFEDVKNNIYYVAFSQSY